jgi:hypothetical protein
VLVLAQVVVVVVLLLPVLLRVVLGVVRLLLASTLVDPTPERGAAVAAGAATAAKRSFFKSVKGWSKVGGAVAPGAPPACDGGAPDRSDTG